jgi:TPR repeat protein
MRTPERIIALAALGLGLGLTPGFAFEGTSPPDVVVVPAPPSPTVIPAPRRVMSVDVPRPPAPIPRGAGGVSPVLMPDTSVPRANPMVPPPVNRTLPPPSAPAFAAPAAPITPFEAFRSGARALKDGHKEKALVSLEYAAEQGLIPAQWKLGRMYAEGDGVEQSDVRAFEYFSRIADAHADDVLGTPQARFVANAFVALGHYYRDGIPDSDVRRDLGRARHMYAYAASYFGDPDAQYHLARLMLDGNAPRDPLQAARWLKAAASKGQYQAQAVLGRLLFKGEPGVPRQPARGLMWLTLANANAPQETWIADLYNAALKQSTEDERATAGDYLGRWMDGRRD